MAEILPIRRKHYPTDQSIHINEKFSIGMNISNANTKQLHQCLGIITPGTINNQCIEALKAGFKRLIDYLLHLLPF